MSLQSAIFTPPKALFLAKSANREVFEDSTAHRTHWWRMGHELSKLTGAIIWDASLESIQEYHEKT